MSKRSARRARVSRRTDHVQETYYDPFMSNPVKNKQAMVERMYIRILTELSCNRFRWTGLPETTVDARFLELSLFRTGLVVFFRDTGPGSKGSNRYYAMRATGNGPLNMYDNPTSFRTYGNGQMERTLGPSQCVPIWGNYLRIPDSDIVMNYAAKLAKIDRTIEITLDNMRTTALILTSEDQVLSWQNILRERDIGAPAVFGTPALGQLEDIVKVFNIPVDKDLVLNLQLAKAKVWNECMTLLGINNANQDKKERLISGEVDANNDQVESSRAVALTARKQAAAQINLMFPGLDVSVEWNENAGPINDMVGPTEVKVY